MSKLFKILTVSLIGLFIGISLPPSVQAASPTLSFQASKTTIAPDEQLSVSVLINAQGESVSAVELHVSFPSATLQAQSISAGSFLTTVLSVGTVGSGTASIILGSGTTPVTGSGTLATIVFKALAPGNATISFDSSTGVAVIGQTKNYAGTMTSFPLIVSSPIIIDTTPPVISSIGSSAISPTGATLTWSTNEPSDSQVEYGYSTSYGQLTALDASLNTSHRVILSSLSPDTAYHFRVKSKDAAGNLATSADQTFTTTAPPDTTPPTVSISAPANGATVSGTTSVTAFASDNVGVVGVQFKLDGTNLGAEDTSSPYSYSWNTATASNGSHTLSAVARDAAGNQTTSNPVMVTVNNTVADTKAPTVPTYLSAKVVSSSSINLSWAASTDNIGVVGYYIYRCQGTSNCTATIQIGNSTAKSFVDNGLSASTYYRYRIKAFDAAGNVSSYSSSASAKTKAPPDITPPSISITAPMSGSTISGTVSIKTLASDNVKVAGVQFKLDGVNLGREDTLSPFSYSWSTRTASNGSHTLTAVARDAAGNKTTSAPIVITVKN